MYTGTLIEELLRTVEQAERNIQRTPGAEEKEWRTIFELRSSELGSGLGSEQREQIFAGAA
jgi:hypothetical protein